MEDAGASISTPNGITKPRPRPRVVAANQPEPETQSISASRAHKRASTVVSSPPSSPILKKKRKSVVGLDESASSVLQPRRSERLEGPSKPPEPRPTLHPSTSSLSVPDETPSISRTSSIKRVRLIVRRPPPSYTNPRQKPPPPKFASNLTDFLSSYTILDEQEQTLEALETLAHKEAALREKIERLHKQGRFVPFMYGESFEGGNATGKTAPAPVLTIAANPNAQDPRRSKDVWEHIVEAIVHRGRHGGGGGLLVRGRQVTTQVANRIQAYWDQAVVREDKARAQEEKRVRALAKATVKMVVSEWKKAVFVSTLFCCVGGCVLMATFW